MSRKAASWTAAALTLFVTLLLGAVLLRPALAEPVKDASTPQSNPATMLDSAPPAGGEYEYEDDDDDWYGDEGEDAEEEDEVDEGEHGEEHDD